MNIGFLIFEVSDMIQSKFYNPTLGEKHLQLQCAIFLKIICSSSRNLIITINYIHQINYLNTLLSQLPILNILLNLFPLITERYSHAHPNFLGVEISLLCVF